MVQISSFFKNPGEVVVSYYKTGELRKQFLQIEFLPLYWKNGGATLNLSFECGIGYFLPNQPNGPLYIYIYNNDIFFLVLTFYLYMVSNLIAQIAFLRTYRLCPSKEKQFTPNIAISKFWLL